MLGELEIISSENISVVERDGRQNLMKCILYHAGYFEWHCMLDLITRLDLYAGLIKKIESGERTLSSDFSDLEHMLLTMCPKAE